MRDERSEMNAKFAVRIIREKFNLSDDHIIKIGLILGTGWGDTLDVEGLSEVSFSQIPGFESVGNLSGHARCLAFGKIADKEILALRGRIHLNEGHGEDVVRMVRLQVEMLFHLGVERLIIASAVGSLVPQLPVGSVAVIKSFITLFAPPMPMWAGEFYAPEDMLDDDLNDMALLACNDAGFNYGLANYVMLRGPFFEGRKNDKRILRELGADVVGMSMLPEACVASVYGVKIIGLGFISNNDTEEHSHEENLARAKKSQTNLGALLANLIKRIPTA